MKIKVELLMIPDIYNLYCDYIKNESQSPTMLLLGTNDYKNILNTLQSQFSDMCEIEVYYDMQIIRVDQENYLKVCR